MKIETYSCDECGSLRRESNHWWMISQIRWPNVTGYCILPWCDSGDRDVLVHLCGLECIQRRLSKLLSPHREEPHAKES